MTTNVVAKSNAPVWMGQLFLISLMLPFQISAGAISLTPHRLVLLALFIPLFFNIFIARKSGRILPSDWLLLGFALWTGVAFAANHPVGEIIEPFGIHTIEFLGGYMLARVAIRSSADFRRIVWTFLLCLAFLVPFAFLESVSGRPVMLQLIPGTSVSPIWAEPRYGLRRAQTIFVHPILFGVFASTGFALFWYSLFPRGLRFGASPMALFATILSLSSGAVLSIIVQLILIGWETVMKALKSRWRLFLILFIIAYIAIDLLSNRTPFHVFVTYGTMGQATAYGRITIFNYGIENVWANPVFGLGLRDWARPAWLADSVDNFWLLNTMRFGIPAFILFVTAIVFMVRQVSVAKLVSEQDWYARAGYLVALGGITVAGATVHYWHAMLAFVMFIYGSGLWAIDGAVARTEEETPAPEPERRSRYTRQPKPGVRIGSAGGSRPVTAPTAEARTPEPRDRARRAAAPSRPSYRRS